MASAILTVLEISPATNWLLRDSTRFSCRYEHPKLMHAWKTCALNDLLVAGLISETVNIVDAIRYSSSVQLFKVSAWVFAMGQDHASKMLGINVGLRSQARSVAAKSLTYKVTRVGREESKKHKLGRVWRTLWKENMKQIGRGMSNQCMMLQDKWEGWMSRLTLEFFIRSELDNDELLDYTSSD